MTNRTGFRVLVATDGSTPARAAVTAATVFPWPRKSRALGLVAQGTPVVSEWPMAVLAALEYSLDREARRARRVLRRRWPDADVVVVDRPPAEGILAQARSLRARAIVLGSRGQGALSRLLLGSVSLRVVRHAPCATLVVKGRLRGARRLVIGLDGSAHSRRAVAFVGALEAPRGGRVTLVAVVEPVRPPSMGLLPSSVRALVSGQLAALAAQRQRAAQREVEAAARRLRQSGWAVRTAVRVGIPVEELLAAARVPRAHVLVVGARGAAGVERLLLGSVAEELLSRSPVSVLIVK